VSCASVPLTPGRRAWHESHEATEVQLIKKQLLVAYSKVGSTREIAQKIAEDLGHAGFEVVDGDAGDSGRPSKCLSAPASPPRIDRQGTRPPSISTMRVTSVSVRELTLLDAEGKDPGELPR
jgi:hypothetical protein